VIASNRATMRVASLITVSSGCLNLVAPYRWA
jgi:hypothetical protein